MRIFATVAVLAVTGALIPAGTAQATGRSGVIAAAPTAQAAKATGVGGTLQPGEWTKVLWGWFATQGYYVSTSPSPVKVREYPVYREYTLPIGGGCVTLNAGFYGDVWLYSENGADYFIGSLC